MSDKKQAKSKFARVCGILVDVLVIPLTFIMLLSIIVMFTAKANNRVPSLFGVSIVKVLSGSMEPKFKKDDVLLIKKVSDLNSLKVGDNIAFYAPHQSGYTYKDGNKTYSQVIFHQIVRIIYVESTNGEEQLEKTRFFVCKGISETSKASSTFYQVEEGKPSNYAFENGEYVVCPNGGYEINLEGANVVDDNNITEDQVQNFNMATMQYVADDFVVGKLQSKAPALIAGFVGFAASSGGVVLLVIIPSLIMIAFILVGMKKEIKNAKEEEQKDKDITQTNIRILKAVNTRTEEEAQVSQPKEENKEEINIENIIEAVVGSEEQKNKTDLKSSQTDFADNTKLESFKASALSADDLLKLDEKNGKK